MAETTGEPARQPSFDGMAYSTTAGKPARFTKRGVPEFDAQPSERWLTENSAFSHKTARGIRATFRKRQKGPNVGQWNCFIYRMRGKPQAGHGTVASAYAGTCSTFDLGEAMRRVMGQLHDRAENGNQAAQAILAEASE